MKVGGHNSLRPDRGQGGPSEKSWHCPLFGRDIAEGKCFDINYERLGYMNGGCLQEIERVAGKDRAEVNKTCAACPRLPLKE
jgi:hypothetical protein